MTLPLSTSNLEAIEHLGVGVPHYDRAALSPRILHLGVGGFHRAHMALYTDELAATWRLDRRFEPGHRDEAAYGRWRRAVTRTKGWSAP